MSQNIQIFRYTVQILYAIFLFTLLFVSLPLVSLIILIATVIGGPFYCGWFCPFGTMQEVINNIARVFKIKQMDVSEKFNHYFVFLRYIFFGFSLLGLGFVFFFDARVFFLDILSGAQILTFAYIVVAIFIIISLFYKRIFCNYFCVQGARFGLFSLFRLFRIKRDKGLCINCKLCDRICPMNIKVSKGTYVKSMQCINCFLCLSKCPKKGTLKYSNLKKKDLVGIMKDFSNKIKLRKN